MVDGNDRGSFEPHKPCNCVDCAIVHGDQVSADDLVIDQLRGELTAIRSSEALLIQRLELVVADRDQAKLELAIATEKAKEGWRNLAAFEREVLRAYRRAKKLSGYVPRQRRPRVVAL